MAQIPANVGAAGSGPTTCATPALILGGLILQTEAFYPSECEGAPFPGPVLECGLSWWKCGASGQQCNYWHGDSPRVPFHDFGRPLCCVGSQHGLERGRHRNASPTSQGRQKGVLRPSPEPGGWGCLGGAWLGACLGSFQRGGCLRKVLRISGSWDTPQPHTALGDKTLIDCLSPLNKTLGNSC